MKRLYFALTVTALVGFVGCTEPGETTGVAAATGGVMGAGLGAIIGSQTGSAGAGLAIGAAAGAATGAAVGNALEAQQQAVQTQDEAIERQEKMIAAQKAEIDELRQLNQDGGTNQRIGNALGSGTYQRSYNQRSPYGSDRYAKTQNDYGTRTREGAPGRVAAAQPAPRFADQPVPRAENSFTSPSAERAEVNPDRSIQSRTLVDAVPRGMIENEPAGSGVEEQTRARLNPAYLTTDECQKAADEARTGDASQEPSERLFHFRRALRMCPDNPDFHTRLGEVYLGLNRNADARYEFQEALKIDPTHQIARSNLSRIK